MNRDDAPRIRLLSPADDYPTERVVDGVLDLTSEIPRVPLLPPVPPPAAAPPAAGEGRSVLQLLRAYWWLLVLMLLEVFWLGPRVGALLVQWSVSR